MKEKKILLLIDCQNDFITGSLPVKDAKLAMDNLCYYIDEYGKDYDKIIVTRDYHPDNHCSFIENGGKWPKHCVAKTVGSEIYAPLAILLEKYNNIHYISKGINKHMDQYSCVYANEDVYEMFNIDLCNPGTTFDVAGLAGDVCVFNTIKDLYELSEDIHINMLDGCIASVEDGIENKMLKRWMLEHYPKQIINHFTDTDFYTFTCQYFALKNFPRSIVKYKFFDRNKTAYPKGFNKLLQYQINLMKNVVITEKEINFIKSKIDFLPDWYYTYLRGFRFNHEYVHISQDENGYLDIDIDGPWCETIIWEMPILACVSELMHQLSGHYISLVDKHELWREAYQKCEDAIEAGLKFSDMGTRRRFSFEHHDNVINAMKQCQDDFDEKVGVFGKFIGSSNVYLCMKYNLRPIGTMSHQCISLIEGLISSPFEANYTMMKLWADTFDGNCGIYLYDCFGDKLFFDNLSLQMAKLYSGLRQDSGDEKEQTLKIIDKYESLGINPKYKDVVYSNGLNLKKAIELHKWINGRVNDSYGIGTFFTGTVKDYTPMNIVIKAIGGKITEKREFHDFVKLSCDSGKTLGNPEKCSYILNLINKR